MAEQNKNNRNTNNPVKRTNRPASEAGQARYVNRDLSVPPRAEKVRSPRPSGAAAKIAKRQRQKKKRREFILTIAAMLLFLLLTVGIILAVIRGGAERVNEHGTEEISQTVEQTMPEEPDTGTSPFTTDTVPVETVPETVALPIIPKAKTNKVICLDPGHGYSDPGAFSEFTQAQGMTERDFTMDMAQQLRTILEEAGYTVIMTHETNDLPAGKSYYLFNPEKRWNYLAGLEGVDLFLSIHCNSAGPKASGARIYYYEKNNDSTPLYAGCLQTRYADLFPDAKELQLYPQAYSDAFLVIKQTFFPSVLYETAFVTNEDDAKNLLDPAWRKKMVQSMALGISDYFNAQEA